MKTVNGSTVFGSFAAAVVISFVSAHAQADALSMKITNKILNDHRANIQAGIVPHIRVANKALDNRVEGAKTVATAESLGAPVINQHPADEVDPARGPKSGHFISKKK